MDNPNNVLITKEEVEDILNYFGNIGNNGKKLEIINLEHYQNAFVHESYHQSILNISNNPPSKIYINYMSTSSNEILEFLGDHVLKLTLGRYLYKRFGTEREGFLTRLKIKIEKCSMLHQIALTLGFKKYLLLSLQIENQSILEQNRGRGTNAYYEDSFEAFLGAIMEDFEEQGYIYAERFIWNIIENIIDFAELINTNDNHKDSLQRYYQAHKWLTPKYININEEGPIYRKIFTRILIINSEQFSQLTTDQQKKIIKYNSENLEYYKTTYPNQYIELFKLLFPENSNKNYILCIGKGRKVTESEQVAAKQGLNILGLDDNY